MKKRILLVASIAIASILAACGGGGGGTPAKAVASNTTLSMNQNTAAAMTNNTFQFSAVPDFGTTTTTTVQVDGSTANNTFQVGSGGNTASGNLQYGSCIFHVLSSNFPVGTPLAQGNTITISACQLIVGTQGMAADGGTHSVLVQFVLNAAKSLTLTAQASVTPDGQLTINGQGEGTVPLIVEITGG